MKTREIAELLGGDLSGDPNAEIVRVAAIASAGDGGPEDALRAAREAARPGEFAPFSLLLLGTYELMFAPDVPFRVAINEAVELAKSYGGTDGHKYVNGVLDKLAAQVRPGEVKKA